MSNPDTDGLKIGDLVTLDTSKWEAYLSAEGILSEDLNVNNVLSEFDNCVFSIHNMRQYSASNELDNFLETYGHELESDKEVSEDRLQYLKALEKGRDNEIRLNDTYLENQIGTPVNFGQVIQLFHCKSKKYLTVNQKELADAERENSRVSLSRSGNTFSHMQLMPHKKIDREGDSILSNNEVYIKVFATASNEYVHCADKSPKPNRLREVNCSLETTPWRLSIFQGCHDEVVPNIVLASTLVYLHDPETRSNLTIAYKQDDIPDEDDEEEGEGSETKSSAVIVRDITDPDMDFFHEYGDMILLPMKEVLDSRSVWSIETKPIIKGGPIQWKTEQIRFRNLKSGMFLTSVTTFSRDEGGHTPDTLSSAKLSVTSDESDPGTLFSIFEMNSTKNQLSISKAVQVYQENIYVERGPERADKSFEVSMTRRKDNALNFLVNPFVQFRPEEMDSVDHSGEPLDVYCCMSIKKTLHYFLDMTIIPTKKSTATLWPQADGKKDIQMFELLVNKAKQFAQGFLVSDTGIVLGVDKSNQILRAHRQKLMQELGILDVCLGLIHTLIPVTELYDQGIQSKRAFHENESALIKQGNELLSMSLDFLYYCILDSSDNQMFVADYLPDLLAHLSTQPLAGKCVTAMLSTNMELQETKMGKREVRIFVEKLRASNMNAMYLNLLQSCCSCQGQGVDSNQCKVTDILFENPDGIIIDLIVNDDARMPVEWDQSSIYLQTPANIALEDTVQGYSLYNKGLPGLSMRWRATEEYSAMHLYNEDVPPLSIVYPPMMSFTSNLESNKVKIAVANYFISQMRLGAEMCMDRNYVAMHALDPLFSFDALVSIMKSDNVHNLLKAAACRLLYCLHIDRDPQASSRIPCLSRTWKEVGSPDVGLPTVGDDRINVYALIQILCSEHINEMSGRKWDEYSKSVLEILLGLIKFNFYGSIAKLQDIIGPIISAIDRRLVEYGDPNSKANKRRMSSMMVMTDEEGHHHTIDKKNSWQMRHYEQLESLPVMLFILVLVLAAVGITLWQVIASAEETFVLWIFGLIVLGIFVYDFFMRLYCYWYVYGSGEVPTFLCNSFNIIDQIVIAIDVAFLMLDILGGGGGSGAGLAKTLRLVRLVRLVRILRAAKVIDAFTKDKEETPKWLAPARFSRIPLFELETMTESIKILLFVQGVIEDRNLTLLLQKFYAWYEGQDTRSPSELFAQVIEDSEQLTLDINDMNDVLLDAIMFINNDLVQSALEVLMAHHSTKEVLLENTKAAQLLVHPKRQKLFGDIRAWVATLEQNAETHELWGELSEDDHHATNKVTKEILRNLLKSVRARRYTLEFDEDYMPIKEVQDMLRNLNMVEISMKVLMLMESVEEPEEGEAFDEVSTNTMELCRANNEILYWFALDNATNQAILYESLDNFIESLEGGISAHKVIKAIFRNNEELMKLVPHSLIEDMTDSICQSERDDRSHHHLALASSITHVGEKNNTQNQFEIVRSMCSPNKLPKTAAFLVPVDSDEYAEKKNLMAEFKDKVDVDLEALPPLLAYHLCYLEMLSNCTSGKINISAVEAKVQSIFGLKDVVEGILDPDAILIVKIRLAQFLFAAIIDVEMALPGLCESKYMWDLIESFVELLTFAKDELRNVEKKGWESPDVSRHRVEYIIVAIMIIGSFFAKNYDADKIRADDGTSSADRVNLSLGRVNEIIRRLFDSITEVYDMDSFRLTTPMKAAMYEALLALNESSTNVIVTYINKSHEDENEVEEELEAEEQYEHEILEKYNEFIESITGDEDLVSDAEKEITNFIEVYEALPPLISKSESDIRLEPFLQKLVLHIRENLVTMEHERKLDSAVTTTATWLIKSFRVWIEEKMEMSIHDRDDDGGEEEDEKAGPTIAFLNNNNVTGLCLDLIAPGIDETLQSEVIKLLVGMLFKEGGALDVQERIHEHLTKTNSVLFFKQVKNTIQRLVDWHEWNGIVEIGEDEDPDLPDYVLIIRFLQLLAEGHYGKNQEIMREQPNNHLTVNLLDSFVNYLGALSKIPCKTSTEAAIRVGATIVEVIQGPCIGNQKYFTLETELLEIQNRIMRCKCINDCDQEAEIEYKKNCLDTVAALLEGQTRTDFVTIRILSVMHLDVIQILARPPEDPSDAEEEEEEDDEVLLHKSMKIKAEMHESVETPEGVDEDKKSAEAEEEKGGEEEEDEDPMEELRIACIVMLQTLCDFKPELREELKEDRAIAVDLDELSGSTASVEINWDGVLNRRFFHVPELCNLLAKTSKDSLVMNVERENHEAKLLDFLERAKALYEEVCHQRTLTELGIAHLFSPQVKNNLTWFTFYLAVIINVLFVVYYDAKGLESLEESPTIPDDVRTGVNILNYMQIVASVCVVIVNFVVKTPVLYKLNYKEICEGSMDEEPSFETEYIQPMTVWYHTLTDTMTLYHIGYLTFACLGAFVDDMWITFLLLDLISKNSTTLDVLMAVYKPADQLAVAFIMGAFIIYIYTFYIFYYMPYRITSDDDQSPGGSDEMDCTTLWGCYKYVFSYGFRAGGGIGEMMYHDIDHGAWLHISFFLVVTVAMLNIIFGLIIDQFSQLRQANDVREDDTKHKCFVCSYPRQVFDRNANSPEGFKIHIKDEHHMWNYLYFIFYIWEQDKDDDDGLEYYVRHKMIGNEITWFPHLDAMCLNLGQTDFEILRDRVFDDINETEAQLTARLNGLEEEVNKFLSVISQTINQDYSGAPSIKKGISNYLKKAMQAEEDEEEQPTQASPQASPLRVPSENAIHIENVINNQLQPQPMPLSQVVMDDDMSVLSYGEIAPPQNLIVQAVDVRLPGHNNAETFHNLLVEITDTDNRSISVTQNVATVRDEDHTALLNRDQFLTVREDYVNNVATDDERFNKTYDIKVIDVAHGNEKLCEIEITLDEMLVHMDKDWNRLFNIGERQCHIRLGSSFMTMPANQG